MEVMRNLIIIFVVLISLLPLKVEALVNIKEIPHQKTMLEELPELLQNVSKDALTMPDFVRESGSLFMIYPKSGTRYPTNIYLIIVGTSPRQEVNVDLYEVVDDEFIFFRKANFCYHTTSERNAYKMRYNLHLKNNAKYQVRISVRGQVVVNKWFLETRDKDEAPQVDSFEDDD